MKPTLTEAERYLVSILTDPSGIDFAEFAWTDRTTKDNLFRCYPYQYHWFRHQDRRQIDSSGRSVGKSLSIQMRASVFPFLHPGQELLITAPEQNHMDQISYYIKSRVTGVKLSAALLPQGRSRIIRERPLEVRYSNGARVVGRIPNIDGRGIKGVHPIWIEHDEAQDYARAGWIELIETLKYGTDDSVWRVHGVTRGLRDFFYKFTQSPDWKVHRITACHRPDWSDDERAAKIEMYGSRHSPDYRRNILGQHGDSSSPLFVASNLSEVIDDNEESSYNNSEYWYIRLTGEQVRDCGETADFLVEPPYEHLTQYKQFWAGCDVGMCVDDSTEIFTQRGWLSLDEVQAGDRTLAVDEQDGKSYWTDIDSVHVFEDNGTGSSEWDLVRFKGQSFDALVTPNHRWLVRSETGNWRWKTTLELNTKDRVSYAVPRGDSPELPSYEDELVALAAWFFTEGSCQGNKCTISQSLTVNPENVASIRKSLSSLYGPPGLGRQGFLWREVTRLPGRIKRLREDDEIVEFHISGAAARELLKLVPGKEHVPTMGFLTDLTAKQLSDFLAICIAGDGWVQDGRSLFQQGSESRTKAYEVACVLAGIAVATHEYRRTTNLRSDEHSYWHTGQLKRAEVRPVSAAAIAARVGYGAKISKERYVGRIWCPRLSRGNWLARRNGSIYFTGNTTSPSEILIFGETHEQLDKGQVVISATGQRKIVRRKVITKPEEPVLKLIGRIHMERLSGSEQVSIMEKLARHYRWQAFGIDRNGVGLMPYQECVASEVPELAETTRGYSFSEKIFVGYDKNREGAVSEEDPFFVSEGPRKLLANALEYSSDRLRELVDCKRIILPYDRELIREFQGQSVEIVASAMNPYGKKEYSRGKFHCLDAARLAVLCYFQVNVTDVLESEERDGPEFIPVMGVQW